MNTGLDSTSTPAPAARWDRCAWLALLVVLMLAGTMRAHFLKAQLERDEGEYAYAGQLILQGVPPYVQIYNMKMPGIYACYALMMAVFGESSRGIHLGLIAVNSVSTILVFLLARRFFTAWSAVAAAAVFAAMSIFASTQDLSANSEHFVLVPVLAGLLLLLDFSTRNPSTAPLHRRGMWSIFIAGFPLGLGFIIKQHAAAFVAGAAIYILLPFSRRLESPESDAKASQSSTIAASPTNPDSPTNSPPPPSRFPFLVQRLFLFFAGAALPLILTFLVFLLLNATYNPDILGQFIFWTFTYAGQYVQEIPLSSAWTAFRGGSPFSIFDPTLPLWGLGVLGLLTLAWDRRVRAASPFLLIFLLFSFLAVCPGFYFRPHYFILMMPAIALWAGAATHVAGGLLARCHLPGARWWAPLALAGAAVACTFTLSPAELFAESRDVAAQSIYHGEAFSAAADIADYIRAHTAPGDRIAVLGSEPEIYFFAHRRSATGYVYMYPLMEDQPFAQGMQRQLIREVEAAQPAMLVYVCALDSWLRSPKSCLDMFSWWDQYSQHGYVRVGLVDLNGSKGPEYLWGDAARRQPPQKDGWIAVYRRLPPEEETHSPHSFPPPTH